MPSRTQSANHKRRNRRSRRSRKRSRRSRHSRQRKSLQWGKGLGPPPGLLAALNKRAPQMKEACPTMITHLANDEVFVFGSNLAGSHGGGAARAALKWGAQMGNPVGPQGATYAIPTLDSRGETLTQNEMKPFVDDFIDYATAHPHLTFLVTEIGCGIAGHTPSSVAPLFRHAKRVKNIKLPASFLDILER